MLGEPQPSQRESELTFVGTDVDDTRNAELSQQDGLFRRKSARARPLPDKNARSFLDAAVAPNDGGL